jgi:nucleoside-diphosphate-sugar epimerase
MSTYFKDKVVIVTGGTDGIGKALVEELIKKVQKFPPVVEIMTNFTYYKHNSPQPNFKQWWPMSAAKMIAAG